MDWKTSGCVSGYQDKSKKDSVSSVIWRDLAISSWGKIALFFFLYIKIIFLIKKLYIYAIHEVIS